MASKPTLFTYHTASFDNYNQTQYTAFDTTANARNLDLRFYDGDQGVNSNPNYFTIIPGAITYSFPLYFSIFVTESYNSLSNPSYKINANTFGANSKISIYGSTQTSYSSWTNPSSTGDPLFSTTSLVTYFVPGSLYGFGGTPSSSYSTAGGVWTQAMRMQLKVDNSSNNADVVNPLNYTVTYSWTET